MLEERVDGRRKRETEGEDVQVMSKTGQTQQWSGVVSVGERQAAMENVCA